MQKIKHNLHLFKNISKKKLILILNGLKKKKIHYKNPITNEEIEIINKSIEELNNILQLTNSNCLLNINLEDKNVKNNMIKLFILNKTKNLYYYHLKYYNKINDIMKTINSKDLSFQPQQMNIQIINLDEQKKEKRYEIINSLNEFDNFLKDTFKIIDLNNKLEGFNLYIQNLRNA